MFTRAPLLLLAPLVVTGCAPSAVVRTPMSAGERGLSDDPMQHGAPAVILLREDSIADGQGWGYDAKRRVERCYYRIKILSSEGRAFGDVEIPYLKGLSKVKDIEARVLEPDGSVREFGGAIVDKTLFATDRLEVRAKAFSLPDVRVGSIIEYSWLERGKIRFGARWKIQDQLDTLHAKFRMERWDSGPWAFSWVGMLPKGAVVERKDPAITLDVSNVAAFHPEPFMPPRTAEENRVEFFYGEHGLPDPPIFWGQVESGWREALVAYIGEHASLRTESASIVGAEQDPRRKLEKIYARVQKIRNVRYQPLRRGERGRDVDITDVLRRNIGTPIQITAAFVALARAAGFDATVARLAERDRTLFEPKLLDADQLDAEVVIVPLGKELLFLDPGTPLCPFGTLAWQKTAVSALRLGGGGGFVATPWPKAADAKIDRKVSLDLREDGSARMTLRVRFFGLEALDRRLAFLDQPLETKNEALREAIVATLPADAKVQSFSAEGWDSPDLPIEARLEIELPRVAIRTPRRLILAMSPAVARARNPFVSAERTYRIYFPHPYEESDETSLHLPAGWEVETLPVPQEVAPAFARYHLAFEAAEDGLHARRTVGFDGVLLGREVYPGVREFFANVKASDADFVVLRRSGAGK